MKQKMKTVYFKISIKVKWNIFICVLITYPIFFIGYVGYRNYEKIITSYFVESVQNDIELVLEDIKQNANSLQEFMREVRYDEAIHKFNRRYAEISQDGNKETQIIHSGTGDYEVGEMVKSYLRSVVLSKPEIDLGAYQFYNTSMQYVESKKKSYYEENDFKNINVFKNINIELEKDNRSLAYYVDEDSNIYIGEKLFSRNTFKEVGTIVFKIKKEFLVGRYTKMLEGPKEGVYIVNSNGDVILSRGNISDNKEDKIQSFLSVNPEKGKLYKSENKKQAIIYAQVDVLNLSMIHLVFISKDLLLQNIRRISSVILILCMSTIPIFLIFAVRLYKEIIDPIYTLSGKMQQIENGAIGVVMSSNRKDELGYLFNTFDNMSKKIQYLVNTVYKEEIALKNAEIKLLQDQINPHFLYNTLEMINWKARMTGDNELSEMVEALSGIMEVNIDRRKIPYLTIEEEMKYLDNYMFITYKRFGKKITFKKDIDPETYDLKIPRIILQPLVENAIKHGIEPVGSGTIQLTVKKVSDKLIITIKDNGKGIDEETLKELNDQMDDDKKATGKVGVVNVKNRIKLLYGDTYGMTIKSSQDKGTLITVVLPITTTGEIGEQEENEDV